MFVGDTKCLWAMYCICIQSIANTCSAILFSKCICSCCHNTWNKKTKKKNPLSLAWDLLDSDSNLSCQDLYRSSLVCLKSFCTSLDNFNFWQTVCRLLYPQLGYFEIVFIQWGVSFFLFLLTNHQLYKVQWDRLVLYLLIWLLSYF